MPQRSSQSWFEKGGATRRKEMSQIPQGFKVVKMRAPANSRHEWWYESAIIGPDELVWHQSCCPPTAPAMHKKAAFYNKIFALGYLAGVDSAGGSSNDQ